ncbi:MAG: hypothetical protein EOO20_14775 [Chryseobacterium sp.]|uniref:hypothetical protein n=1 Tax=Pedobacter TaxID=84567 RepID=UPI000F5E5380|nr:MULTISPECIES: hypothetical protein [Pedobacter]AZI27411.1 hypothetical protein EA772_19465 [Pedobacter sp. G11]MDQ1139141.1 hypothetical protein [Pedobacter agri]RZJ87982.1 MAG: hypothetical protein EOO20_14775 [Chryseobacterium sp.]
MEELINQLKSFLGNRVEAVRAKGPAELEIVIGEMEDVERLSSELKAHIVELVDENTLAKIDFVTAEGKEIDSFSLTQ